MFTKLAVKHQFLLCAQQLLSPTNTPGWIKIAAKQFEEEKKRHPRRESTFNANGDQPFHVLTWI